VDGRYSLAEKTIAIRTLYPQTHTLLASYRAEGSADFSVETARADLERERGDEGERWSDGYLETLAVYRKIAEKMPDYDTFLFHGSCVAVDGAGYLFAAASGTGKSTHTRLWRELLGERAVMVNDDKPLLRVTADGAVVYGTPWDGKHRLSANIAVPLRGLCILARAEKNAIRRVGAAEAYPLLLQQVYRPADADALRKTLTLLDRLAASVPLWRLGCNMDIEAARVAYDAMKG